MIQITLMCILIIQVNQAIIKQSLHMSSMAMDTNNTIIHGKDPTHTGHKRSYMEVNMEEKADLMNTEKEEENTSTISLA